MSNSQSCAPALASSARLICRRCGAVLAAVADCGLRPALLPERVVISGKDRIVFVCDCGHVTVWHRRGAI